MLTSKQAPNGTTRLSDWLAAHRDEVGDSYTSEMARHFRWRGSRETTRRAARLG